MKLSVICRRCRFISVPMRTHRRIKFSQIHILSPYFLKTSFNIILPMPPMSSEWLPAFRRPDQQHESIHLPMSASLFITVLTVLTIFDVYYKLWRSLLFSSAPCFFVTFRNMLAFQGEELLAPRGPQPPNQHLLAAVCSC